MRRLGVVLAVCCLLALPAGSGAATKRAAVGVFNGYAFDACSAPSSASLQAWTSSPYRALGVYIGGQNRACKQPNLTAQWVSSTLASGWSLLPLYVGLQAPCVGQSGLAHISTSAATAATQGRAAADDAALQAGSLGLPAGSPVWFDLEGYHLGDAACTRAVQSFVTAWVSGLHAHGLLAGLYGSAASSIRDAESLSSAPDVVWIANWNGVQGVFGDPYVPDSAWPNHQRVHQYKGGHRETYGGVTIDVDSSVVDSTVVGGTLGAPAPPPTQQPTVGQVASGDGLATASWPAAAFTTPAAVTLTPLATPPSPTGYGVQLTATETDNQAPIDGFGAPVVVHLLEPPAALQPAFSSDGTTWSALPKVPSSGLSQSRLAGYTLLPDGTVQIQTLVPGWFGLVADSTPPAQPTLTGRLRTNGLYLSWPAATDDGGIASYTVLRNGTPLLQLPAAGRRAIVRTPGAGSAQAVYRLEATDLAGNTSAPSRPVVVLPKKRPAGVPRAVPHWAYALYAYQHHTGTRPRTAPRRPPSWYWAWAAWRAQPYRLR